jgi:thiamine kinase-like enzyme
MNEADRIAALPVWQGRPDIEPVTAGRTNRNFTVRDGDRRYFARVGTEIPQHGISRAVERRCATLAAQAGIAPEVIYAEGGIMITTLVSGETLDIASAQEPQTMARIAGLLRRLHAIPRQDDLPDFCPVAVSQRYLSLLPDAVLPMRRGRIAACLALLPSLPSQCLIHADLIPENFIGDGDRLWLVDWEYAGNGVPATDLAMIISNFGLGGAASDAFLDAYGPVDSDVVQGLRIAATIREALWCLAQAEIGGVTGDLPQYTALCLGRLEQVLR